MCHGGTRPSGAESGPARQDNAGMSERGKLRRARRGIAGTSGLGLDRRNMARQDKAGTISHGITGRGTDS